MIVLPVYRHLGSKKDTANRAHFQDTHDDMLRATYHGQFRDRVTLCTMGSVYHNFPSHHRDDDWQIMKSVRLCDVEEASQVSDDYFFPMLNCIEYSVYPKERNWLNTVFCSEPSKLLPNIGNEARVSTNILIVCHCWAVWRWMCSSTARKE